MPELVMYHLARDEPGPPRLAFSVGSRVGGAVVRNRLKRRLREAARPLVARLVACDILVVARPQAVEATAAVLEQSLREAAARAGVLRTDT